MSWTATLLADARDTGRRIFLEPERVEYTGPRLPYRFIPNKCIIDGVPRVLVKNERFRGNYVLTYRKAIVDNPAEA